MSKQSSPRLSSAKLPLVGVLALALTMSSPSYADDVQLTSISVAPSQSGQQAELVLTLSDASAGSAVSSFTTQDPHQLVIDIADAEAEADVADSIAGGELITDIAVSTMPMDDGLLTRVTISLSGPVEHTLTNNGSELRITMEARSFLDSDDPLADAGLTSPSDDPVGGDDMFRATNSSEERPLSGPGDIGDSVSLTSLDFDKGEASDRVIIGVRGTQAYTDTRPRSSTLIIDVPGAFVPQSLTRPVDTSRFVSPIRSVRAYRTSSGARITITLRSDVEYSIRRGADGLLIVDVPVPASMRDERESPFQSSYSVANSDTDGSMSNGSRDELLIGDRGQTSDPDDEYPEGTGASRGTNVVGATGFLYDRSSSSQRPYAGRRINLDFVNADIHSLFRLISNVSNLNIVSGDDVSGTVTIRLQDVPWDQALVAILQAKGLASERYGNIVRVAPLEAIKVERQIALEAKRAGDAMAELQVLILPLNYSSGTEVLSHVQAMLTERGTVEADSRGNQLIVKDVETTLAQVREIVRALDQDRKSVV